jgi:hypothetical protein
MANVVIRIFQSLDQTRQLVRRIEVQTKSQKHLNGARALSILRREFPELGYIHSLNETDEGWMHSRALEQKSNCSFHYKWESYYVSEEE